MTDKPMQTRFATPRLLKHKDQLFQQLDQPHTWNATALELILLALLGAGIFGAVMSTEDPHWWHTWELSWKMMVTLWGPIALCTPALYVFSSLRGVRVTMSQLVFLLIGSLATAGLVLASLSPLSWFFTWTTDTLEFIKIMNGCMVGLGLLFGLFFLGQGFLHLYRTHKPEGARSGIDILFLWFILLIVVVVQMSQKLAPWYLSVPTSFGS